MFWNQEYKKISISFEDRVVRIKCDRYLMHYLKKPGNDALVLSKYILETYYDMFHKKLKISQNSLAVEILIHAYIDKFCSIVGRSEVSSIEGLNYTIKQVCQSVEKRTEVIDCGEKEVDSNRYLFDALEMFHGFLYKMLGDLA